MFPGRLRSYMVDQNDWLNEAMEFVIPGGLEPWMPTSFGSMIPVTWPAMGASLLFLPNSLRWHPPWGHVMPLQCNLLTGTLHREKKWEIWERGGRWRERPLDENPGRMGSLWQRCASLTDYPSPICVWGGQGGMYYQELECDCDWWCRKRDHLGGYACACCPLSPAFESCQIIIGRLSDPIGQLQPAAPKTAGGGHTTTIQIQVEAPGEGLQFPHSLSFLLHLEICCFYTNYLGGRRLCFTSSRKRLKKVTVVRCVVHQGKRKMLTIFWIYILPLFQGIPLAISVKTHLKTLHEKSAWLSSIVEILLT